MHDALRGARDSRRRSGRCAAVSKQAGQNHRALQSWRPGRSTAAANRREAEPAIYGEMAGVGATAGPAARRLMDLTDPSLDWVGLAQAQGVEAARADTMERFDEVFMAALSRPGPMLIELAM